MVQISMGLEKMKKLLSLPTTFLYLYINLSLLLPPSSFYLPIEKIVMEKQHLTKLFILKRKGWKVISVPSLEGMGEESKQNKTKNKTKQNKKQNNNIILFFSYLSSFFFFFFSHPNLVERENKTKKKARKRKNKK